MSIRFITQVGNLMNKQVTLLEEIAGLKARIEELEANQKPKDNSEYGFYLKEDMNNKTFIAGFVNDTNYYYLRIYQDHLRMGDSMAEVRLSENQLQTIVDTLQKVINDGVLR